MMTLKSLDRDNESAGHNRPSQNEPENTVKDNEKDMQQKQQSCDESLVKQNGNHRTVWKLLQGDIQWKKQEIRKLLKTQETKQEEVNVRDLI